LSEIVRRLVDAYRPLRIFLFGSKARGDAGPDSDYDLMVIVPDDAALERRSGAMAYDCLWECRIAADILVWTQSSFNRRKHIVSSLPATIMREGKLLYVA
jgi:hypothetical protein